MSALVKPVSEIAAAIRGVLVERDNLRAEVAALAARVVQLEAVAITPDDVASLNQLAFDLGLVTAPPPVASDGNLVSGSTP